jgi:hypothetical protein
LDQINLTWVRRLLPATAVVIGMRYNSHLIDEVIGVAQATFAPDAKLANRAITDDSSSEAEVSNAADSQGDDQQDAKDQATETTKKDTEKNSNKKKDSVDESADSESQSNDTDKAAKK